MKLALEVGGSLLAIVLIIGGYFTWAGMPPYVEHDNHKREYRTLEIEVVGGALQQQKREMLKNVSEKAEWFKYYEQGLRDLKAEKAKTDKTVGKFEKRLETP